MKITPKHDAQKEQAKAWTTNEGEQAKAWTTNEGEQAKARATSDKEQADVRSASDGPGCIIYSYGCHPVIVYGYDGSAISADFPGGTRKELRKAFGEKTHVQFVQGLAGNIRPRIVADVANNRFRTPKPEDTVNTGSELAQDILTALMQSSTVLKLDLAGSMDQPLLYRDAPPPRSYYEKLLTNAPSKPLQSVARYWLERYDSGDGFAKADVWPTGLIRLADNQWVCYLAGEPCAEWEPLISKWLAPHKVVVWGYCQESNTYLPTENLLPEDGYEVLESNRARASSPAKFAPGIEDSIRKSLLKQAATIELKVENR